MGKFCRRWIFALIICSLGNAEAADSPSNFKISLNVERYVLSNGLTVLLLPDHSAPLVSYQTWFKVGSRDEEPGYTGMAHLFEHMMFKGARRYDGKTFDRLLNGAGATHNAFTTKDHTTYYATLPSSHLELVIDLESDRMESLQVTAENLKSEREVVKEERRYRTDNQVMGKLQEVVYATLFKTYPYKWPVVGWMEDIDRITLEKCRQFFKTYYAPNNAVVVVSGDFSPSEAKGLIQRYYGHIPAQPIPPRQYPAEPPQKDMREQRLWKNVQNEYISLAFKTVPAGVDEYYALDVLASIMGEGNSSWLYKKMVYQKQLASQINVSHAGAQGPSVFQILAVLKPGASHDEALKTIFNDLWDARNRLVSEKELAKAKNMVIKSYIESLKTVNGRAMSVGYNEVLLGSYEHLLSDLEKYGAVTAEKIRLAASAYLNPNQRALNVVVGGAAPPSVAPAAPAAPATSPKPSGGTSP